jgi:hypothetical protein
MAEERRVPFFVGHAFTDKKMDDLREAINEATEALPQFSLKAIYANEILGTGHIFEKIKILISRGIFCVFDITENDRPNIYFELGFAHGIRKPYFLICQEGAKIPSDLAGYEFLSYRSYKDLREKLALRLHDMVNVALQTQPKVEVGRVELIGPVLKRLEQSRAPIEELIQIAQAAGFSKDDLMRTIRHFMHTQMIGAEEEKFFLRADGKDFTKQFFDTYKDQPS